MSNIFFLGQEDREGLARLQNPNRGLLTFDAEVGGWDRMGHNDGIVCSEFDSGDMPVVRAKMLAGLFSPDEPALKVFDSRPVEQEPAVKDEEAAWPTITYQVRFGNDQ